MKFSTFGLCSTLILAVVVAIFLYAGETGAVSAGDGLPSRTSQLVAPTGTAIGGALGLGAVAIAMAVAGAMIVGRKR